MWKIKPKSDLSNCLQCSTHGGSQLSRKFVNLSVFMSAGSVHLWYKTAQTEAGNRMQILKSTEWSVSGRFRISLDENNKADAKGTSIKTTRNQKTYYKRKKKKRESACSFETFVFCSQTEPNQLNLKKNEGKKVFWRMWVVLPLVLGFTIIMLRTNEGSNLSFPLFCVTEWNKNTTGQWRDPPENLRTSSGSPLIRPEDRDLDSDADLEAGPSGSERGHFGGNKHWTFFFFSFFSCQNLCT